MSIFGKLLQNKFKNPIVKVYSHPRSGTHLTEALLAKNFYPGEDFSVAPITWGHWSNRLQKEEGNKYGKLFGSHMFPEGIGSTDELGVYVVRDPRAVAYSIWKTPNFVNTKDKEDGFIDFLNKPLDWRGTPSNKKIGGNETIFEHWLTHVGAWEQFCQNNDNFTVIRFEEIVENTPAVIRQLSKELNLHPLNTAVQISKPVGLLPNQASINAWKEAFSEQESAVFKRYIPEDNPYLSD